MRGREGGQFGTFDSIDNRKWVFRMLDELGYGMPEMQAAEVRARWLRSLIRYSENGFAEKMIKIGPCDPVAAYNAFIAITGVLGVPVEKAAELLEAEMRR